MSEKEKIMQYLEYKGISKSEFYRKTGLSQGFLNSGKSLGVDKAKIIINTYPDINLEWLVMNSGPMLRDQTEKPKPAAPDEPPTQSDENQGLLVDKLMAKISELENRIFDLAAENGRLHGIMSLNINGIKIIGGGNLPNPPTQTHLQCGSTSENLNLDMQNPSKKRVSKHPHK